MARRSVPPPQPKTPVLTVGQKQRRIERLRKCIQRLEAFDPQKRDRVPEVRMLEADIDKALSLAFGYGTARYLRYNLAAMLLPGPLTTNEAPRAVQRPVGGPGRHAAQAQEARQKFSEGKERSIALLREAICTLEGEIAEAQPIVESVKSHSVEESAQESKATQKEDEVRSLQPRLWGGIDLKAAWHRMGRWWRGRN